MAGFSCIWSEQRRQLRKKRHSHSKQTCDNNSSHREHLLEAGPWPAVFPVLSSFLSDLFLLSVWVGLLFLCLYMGFAVIADRVAQVKVHSAHAPRSSKRVLSRMAWRQGWLLNLPERLSLERGLDCHVLFLEIWCWLQEFEAHKLHF